MGAITTLVQNFDNAIKSGVDVYEGYDNASKVVDKVADYLMNDGNLSRELTGLIAEYGVGAVAGALVAGALVAAGALPGAAAAAGLLAGVAVGDLANDLGKGFHDLLHDPSTWSNTQPRLICPGPNLAIPRNQRINGDFQACRAWTPPRDPLALDLDGDGIETTGITATTQILFDHDGDGVKTGTGWVKGDDAWLNQRGQRHFAF